jgi:hypothetical protein
LKTFSDKNITRTKVYDSNFLQKGIGPLQGVCEADSYDVIFGL